MNAERGALGWTVETDFAKRTVKLASSLWRPTVQVTMLSLNCHIINSYFSILHFWRVYLALFHYATLKVSDHGIHHVESESGRYQISFSNAAKQCAEKGMILATKGQLTIAYNQGFEVCSCGWVTDKNAYYPMQVKTNGCGRPGINSCGKGQNYDVYCYENLEIGKF